MVRGIDVVFVAGYPVPGGIGPQRQPLVEPMFVHVLSLPKQEALYRRISHYYLTTKDYCHYASTRGVQAQRTNGAALGSRINFA